jgi:hypothetical protein
MPDPNNLSLAAMPNPTNFGLGSGGLARLEQIGSSGNARPNKNSNYFFFIKKNI